MDFYCYLFITAGKIKIDVENAFCVAYYLVFKIV